MIPIHPHVVSSSLLALPAAVALTRKLLHDRKSSILVEAGSPADRMNQIERRAKTLTETLKNIVGYHHHGLNE
jgi:glyoxylase-like metal-dependent hydrolase (beta-lactamase superfamily II)